MTKGDLDEKETSMTANDRDVSTPKGKMMSQTKVDMTRHRMCTETFPMSGFFNLEESFVLLDNRH